MGGNSVSNRVGLSGPAHPPKEKYSLSGPTHPPKEKYSLQTDTGEPCSNPFVCYALGNGNGKQVDNSNKKYKVYTDTDSDGKTEIITDITCKFKGKVFAMEVKVDPGSETNCIPLSHFRRLFPQMCNNEGKPKEGSLEPTLAQFEAYNGGIMHAHGWTIMPTQNISDYKFHPVRYYVVEREDARILISHATVTWLGLVKVLCTNKASRCKRQVASVTKKLKKPAHNNSHFRTSTPSQREIFSARTTTSSQREIFSHNNNPVMKTPRTDEEAISTSHSNGRKCWRAKKTHREEDRSVEHPSVTRQDQVTNSLASREVQSWPVQPLAGPAHPPKEKYTTTHNNRFKAHFRTSTSSQSEIFSKTSKRQDYQPQEDQETYTINTEGHLQCNQDSNKVIQAPAPQDLPGSQGVHNFP